jgi:hypothetical protein
MPEMQLIPDRPYQTVRKMTVEQVKSNQSVIFFKNAMVIYKYF